jgi:hypothetical protein
MVRIALAALAGAVVLFVWGAVSWMLIPWHQIDPMPNEDAVIRDMENRNETGIYWFPWTDPRTLSEEDHAAQVAKHERGPVGVIVYSAEGREVMPVAMHVKGFVLDLVGALVASIMLSMAATALGGYVARVLFVTLLGVFVAALATMMQWNYMLYPLDYSLHLAADNVVAALLLGLVLGAIIKAPSYREAAIGAVT